jgi:hypothetical protein
VLVQSLDRIYETSVEAGRPNFGCVRADAAHEPNELGDAMRLKHHCNWSYFDDALFIGRLDIALHPEAACE